MNKTLLTGRNLLGTLGAVLLAASTAACEASVDSGSLVDDPTADAPAAEGSAAPGEAVGAEEAASAATADETEETTISDPQTFAPSAAPTLPSGCPSLNLKTSCGAKGDGVTNDTTAFQTCAAKINAAKCGEVIVPPATYIVGRQKVKTSSTASGPWYDAAPIFEVSGLRFLRFSAYGAKIRVASGLHYGAFSPTTGEPIDVTGGENNRADVGQIVRVSSSDNVYIEGGEYDGNNTKLVLGGQWGDKQRQTAATGIWINMSNHVFVTDVYTHHHGLDGITVLYRGGRVPSKMPHKLLRVKSEYNGRQGLSWIGGWGLEVIDSKFNHTGRAINVGGGRDNGLPMYAAPGAGLDIEPNASTDEISRDGVFTHSEFVNNAGVGMLADVGDGGYSTFNDCTFWGTTSYSIWPKRPGLKFINSRIYGTAVHPNDGHTDASAAPNASLANYFEGCTFEDKPWTDGQVKRNGSLFNMGGEGDLVKFKSCTFRNHAVQAISAGDTTTREYFDNCTFIHDYSTAGSGAAQATFAGSQLTSCLFQETTAISSGTKNYFISTSNVRVATPPPGARATRVNGPRVKWDSASGRTGDVAPGTY